MLTAIKKLLIFGDEIKFPESIFALPFAYVGMVLASNGLPELDRLIWITVAMISARTSGMAANRLIDRHIDARNPRTSNRSLPNGNLSVRYVAIIALGASGLLLIAALQLNLLAFVLAPFTLLYLTFYPYTKRFTWTSSIFLGWALAIAPSAAWIGVRGSLGLESVLLSLAVACWASSFDILYHAQDRDFYITYGLKSLSQRFGITMAFWIARILDFAAIICLLVLGIWMELQLPYFIGCAISAAFITYKYRLVSPSDLTRIGVAFFRINAYVAMTLFLGTFFSLVLL